MNAFTRALLLATLFVGSLANGTLAAHPVFSLELAGVNGERLEGGPVSRGVVMPGDTLLFEVYLRDWSPMKEKISSLQAQMDPASYSSGPTGFIEPVRYEERQKTNEANDANSFVDRDHPLYVYKGQNSLGVADSRSEGYRWAVVIIGQGKPESKQDGKKYYVASLRLLVSKNATGTFQFRLLPYPACATNDQNNASILPLDTESLTIEVAPGSNTGKAHRVVALTNDAIGPDMISSLKLVPISERVMDVVAALNGQD